MVLGSRVGGGELHSEGSARARGGQQWRRLCPEILIHFTMEATGSKSVFNAFKLDRFDGTNFTHWKDKLFFLLTELGVAYLLLHDLPPIPAPTDKDTDEIRATRKKREEDKFDAEDTS
ncbi:hypothetical protein ZIOFF_069642 [Zingiber officinale]|uniref:Uncharacterized protein n=1 Tax=Zingiber officinale TaxID=94328 RepID=A0A8J5C4F3_ZINOF|nr:hypothetical protein ZIOFF_069642 [Zingiber officinale]